MAVVAAQNINKQDANQENIALTGLMGSGKSSVGRTIARLLKRKFVDTDFIIEKEEGSTISKIFETRGEDYFRELEKRIIKRVLKSQGQIISLGGGTIVNEDNRKLIKNGAKLVALVAEPEELYERVKRRSHRPLLTQSEDPLQTLKELWDDRKSAYEDSHVQIKTSGKEVDDVANEIISTLDLAKINNHTLNISIQREMQRYNIYFRKLSQIDLSDINLGQRILIVTQEPIAKHFLNVLKERFASQFQVSVLQIDNGEEAKNFFNFQIILQKCLSLNMERKDTIIALGGGVVGDLAGFAASAYLRGINFIQIPTTLLAMLDSSVGGKTAINVPEGKNLIGSFYQPRMVHIDVNNLQTLPDSEFKSGLGELVKYTLLGSKWDSLLGENFFNFVERNAQKILDKDEEILRDTIDHCLKIKANIVGQDEKEKGIRAYLNLGHTFGHSIEEVTKYQRYSHGEAVAIGIACACHLAELMKEIPAGEKEKVFRLMDALGLNYKIPEDIDTESIIQGFSRDKKVQDGSVRFILPKKKLGRVDIFNDVNPSLVRKAIDQNR